MYRKDISNDLQEILSQAIDKIKQEMGEAFSFDKVNLER